MADRTRTLLSLAAVVIVGLGLGAWLGLRSFSTPLTDAQKNQVAVRIDPAPHQTWQDPCITRKRTVGIPLKNYGAAPVTVTSVTVEAGSGGHAAQPLATSIAPGRTATVDISLRSNAASCITDPITGCSATAESVVYATFTVTPPSGIARSVRLPVAAWNGSNGQLLAPYPMAALANWSRWIDC